MSILEKLFRKRKKIVIEFLVKEVNQCTNVTLYYRCIRIVDNGNVTVTSELIREPSLEEKEAAITLKEADKEYGFMSLIQSAIGKARDNYRRKIRENKLFFQMSNLYHKFNLPENEEEAKTKYEYLLKILNNKCNQLGIVSESDTDKIFTGILKNANELIKQRYIPWYGEEAVRDLDATSFCSSKKEIDAKVKEYDTKKFFEARQYGIIEYYASFITDLDVCIEILGKDKPTVEEKETLRRYLELFRVIPRIMETIDNLKAAEAEAGKYGKQNTSSMSLSSVDDATEDAKAIDDYLEEELREVSGLRIYLSGTLSKDSVENILKKGLNLISASEDDYGSYCTEYTGDTEQIRKYYKEGYGNYIIIMCGFPDGIPQLEDIPEAERGDAYADMHIRRKVFVLPDKRVNRKYIFGYYDSNTKRIILNPNFAHYQEQVKVQTSHRR